MYVCVCACVFMLVCVYMCLRRMFCHIISVVFRCIFHVLLIIFHLFVECCGDTLKLGAHVEIRGQLVGIKSFLPSCGFRG